MSKLKELLFDSEAQRLADLQRHLDMLAESDAHRHALLAQQIADLAESARRQTAELDSRVARLTESEARERLDIVRRLDQLFERTGTEERFTGSVARTLEGALRAAEVERHKEVADALAPLVVRTVKTEIRNSQDELVEALYPMTGRMVKAYVASAMKDLADQINRRLEQNAFMLRLRSLTTGRSVAELALAETQPFKVDELYLIRRGSGELVGRWPDNPGSANRDHVLGGTLAAINEFAADAFKGEGSSLRHIDLDNAQIYLRTSPAYLLAARCSGVAPQSVEEIIDEEFLAAIEANRGALAAGEKGTGQDKVQMELLPKLALHMDARVAEKQRELAAPPLPFSPLRALSWLIALPLLGWLCWSLYVGYETSSVRQTAEQAIAEMPAFKGFPTYLEVEPRGRALTVTGLAPMEQARSALVDKLHAVLPTTQIRDQLGVVPSSLAEAEAMVAKVKRDVSSLETEVMRSSVLRSIDRAQRRLVASSQDIAWLESEVTDPPSARGLVGRLRATVAEASREALAVRAVATDPGAGRGQLEAIQPRLVAIEHRLDTGARELLSIVGGGANTPDARNSDPQAHEGVLAAAEATAAAAERLSTTVTAAAQTNSVRRALPQQTPRQRLEAWVRANAIFFGNNSDFRDPATAERQLDELAALIRQAGTVVRVVGYTDSQGGQVRNSPLSQSRADKVLEALVTRGIARDRLVAVGRLNAVDISPSAGAGSPNRRVEFELGFIGETTQ